MDGIPIALWKATLEEGVDILWIIKCKLICITLRRARDCTLLGLEVDM